VNMQSRPECSVSLT